MRRPLQYLAVLLAVVALAQAAPVVIDVGPEGGGGQDPSSRNAGGAPTTGLASPDGVDRPDAFRRLFKYRSNVVTSEVIVLMHAEVRPVKCDNLGPVRDYLYMVCE